MKKLLGWSLEQQYEAQGLEVWRMVDLFPSQAEAGRAQQRLKAGAPTRVMAYYRVDYHSDPNHIETPVSLPETRRHQTLTPETINLPA